MEDIFLKDSMFGNVFILKNNQGFSQKVGKKNQLFLQNEVI